MLEFKEEYFEAQVVDQFYVRPMIKRAWAAQLEVLEEIAKICKRHNIQYYAEWGTLLGAVRHKGYIPWDDDLDIGMLRPDYERFCYFAKQELPEGMAMYNIKELDDFTDYLTRVVNSQRVDFTGEFMDKYHGCPYSVGVDIFVTDYVPADPAAWEMQSQLIRAVGGLARLWKDPKVPEDEKWNTLEEISQMTGFVFDKSKSIMNQLQLLTEKIHMLYGEEESDDVGLLVLLIDEERYRFPKSCYESFLDVPFENTTIPIPVGYDRILKGRYGENYMVPIKRWGTHDYPVFKKQEKMLVDLFDSEGVPIPDYFDVMPLIERKRFFGVQYHGRLDVKELVNSGMEVAELPFDEIQNYLLSGEVKIPKGICIRANTLIQCGVEAVLKSVVNMGAEYLAIDTREFFDMEALDEVLTDKIELFRWNPVCCYIENGYLTDTYGKTVYNPYSEIALLNETIDAYNMYCGRDCFGICLNVGYANMLGMNLRAFAEGAGERLALVHMNDNDGSNDWHQMPLTFTSGRGERSTDIYRLIGTLVRMDYQGGIVYDVSGLWEQAPLGMQRSLFGLLQGLGKEWESQFALKDKLSRENRKIILFGTGAMAVNYICNWGQEYPPYMMVDNNPEKWGKDFMGVPVKSPEAILEIPETERNVFICNMYYSQISTQLDEMGISYDFYNDNYYM